MYQETLVAQVPELDLLVYHGLINLLKTDRDLAALTQHAPSQNLGENTSHLQTMVNATKQVEPKINHIVLISMGNNYRRIPVGGNTEGQSFLTLLRQRRAVRGTSNSQYVIAHQNKAQNRIK